MNTKHNPPNDPIIVTSIRMTPDQHASLKSLATSRHRTISQELRVAIDNHLLAVDPTTEKAA